jgi:beta-lactamase superfamily II metal-dependent hydrolase
MNRTASHIPAHLSLIALMLLPVAAGSVRAQSLLRIYHIDVDQGAATLIVSPDGRTLLVDAGRDGHGSRVRDALNRAGASRIDHLVTTHYHDDHYGGTDELTQPPAIPVGQPYDRGDKPHVPLAKRNGARFRDYERTVGHRALHLQRGQTIQLGAEVMITCIASGGAVLGEQSAVPGRDENDMSIALLVQWGNFRYFVGGDIEHFTEEKIAALDAVLDVDIYQANHHGSHTSTSSAFIRDLAPTVVIISNGDRADYMHPRQVTLDTLARVPGPPVVLQTNRYTKGGEGGNVAAQFIADPDPSGSEGMITVTVDGARNAYSVAYAQQTRGFVIKPRSVGSPPVVLESLLPDPVGADLEREEVTLRNRGTAAVDLAGWMLRDESGRVWPLTDLGLLAPGGTITALRRGRPMSLDNDGDEIVLLGTAGQVLDRFRYAGSSPGVRISTGH